MTDEATLHEFGDWLVNNQHLKGSPEWNDVAGAFNKLDGQLQGEAQRNASYKGITGGAKAALQGAAVGATGDTLDMLNLINPLNYAVEGIHSAVTGQPFKMNRASAGYERLFGAPEDVAPTVRPQYYGGRMAGGAAMTSLLTGGLASAIAPELQGANMVSRGLKAIDANKKAYTAAELAAAGGAGAGTAAADYISPDNPTGHLIGGIAGSIAGPQQLVRYARQGVGKATQGRVGQVVGDLFDPNQGAAENTYRLYQDNIIEQQRAAGLPTDEETIRPLVERSILNDQAHAASLPEGAPTNFLPSEVVQGVSKTLASKSPSYGYSLKQKGENAMVDLSNLATSQLGASDPRELLAAAKARAEATTARAGARAETLRNYANTANSQAVDAGKELVVSPQLEGAIGPALQQQFQKGMMAGKSKLDDLESAIPNKDVLGRNIANRLGTVMDRTTELFPTSDLSADTHAILTRIKEDPNASVEQYRSLYSQLRHDERLFRANPEKQRAAELAGRLGDTLSNAFRYRKVPGIHDFNAAAKQFYDTYGRAPGVTEMLDKGRRGGAKKIPDVAVENILSGTTINQAHEIENALRAAQNPDIARNLLETGQRAQVGRSLVDAETFMSDAKGISEALKKEGGIYGQFPKLTEDMLAARASANQAAELGSRASNYEKFASDVRGSLAPNTSEKAGTTAKILGFNEDPIRLIEGAVSSANPAQALDNLYRTANRSGGKEGLKGILRDYLAASKTPVEAAQKALTPLSQGSKTNLAQWMRGRGLISSQEYADMHKALSTISEAERAKSLGVPAVDLEAKMPDVLDAASRMFGASAGSWLSGLMGKRTLIGAEIGSKNARKLLDRLTPRQRTLLEGKMLHPDEYSQFLENVLASSQKAAPTTAQQNPFRFGLHPATQAAVANRYRNEKTRKPTGLLN